jgi:hypothetical protein
VSKAADIVGDSRAFFSEKFADKTQTVLYLYLINEVTHKPVIPPAGSHSPYPIVIKAPSDFVTSMMPLIKTGLAVLSVYNGVAGLAQCFGPPLCFLPRLPADMLSSAKLAVGNLDAGSSVANFDALQGAVDEAQNGAKEEEYSGLSAAEAAERRAKAVRGKKLLDLAAFYSEHDKECNFAGLQRVLAPDGSCLWTTEADLTALRAKIDKEAKEEAEAPWSDKSVGEQAAAAAELERLRAEVAALRAAAVARD